MSKAPKSELGCVRGDDGPVQSSDWMARSVAAARQHRAGGESNRRSGEHESANAARCASVRRGRSSTMAVIVVKPVR